MFIFNHRYIKIKNKKNTKKKEGEEGEECRILVKDFLSFSNNLNISFTLTEINKRRISNI